MSHVNRRDMVKLVAGLTIGAGVATAQEPRKAADPMLENALKNPDVFMFAEQVTFKTSITEPHSFDPQNQPHSQLARGH